jgi:hypothetical protein
MWHPLSAEVDNNFADKQRPLGRYSLLADSGQRVCLSACFFACFPTLLRYLSYPFKGPAQVDEFDGCVLKITNAVKG